MAVPIVVAHRDLVFIGVQGDFGAQVRAVHDANVVLRRADVAWILEGNPGVSGLKQHRQHLAPELRRRHLLEQRHRAFGGFFFVSDISGLKGTTELLVQVRHVRGREQRPFAVVHDALHEEVGNPVCRIHVMGATTVIAGVLAQLEEFLDIEVPGFQIGADRALALAALIHRHRRIVNHLQERHHTL